MKLHKAAHTVYKTQYHIVWVTRFRRKILVEGVATYLRVKLREVQQYYPDWHCTEIGTDKDHVHVHMVIPPKDSVSFAVETIKKTTSRALRETFQFLDKGGRGSRRNLVQGLLCVHGWDHGRDHSAVRGEARTGRRGTSAA